MRGFTTMLGLTLVLGIVLLPTAARADDPVTWNFDVDSSGEDVHWVSPTAVDPGAQAYVVNWEITLMEVTVRYLIWDFIVDGTDQIPEELRVGGAVVDGPAPVIVFDAHIAYPEPPEVPGVEANIELGINAAGNGYVDVTDLVLGEVTVTLPGFGEVTVDVQNIRLAGSVTVEAVFGMAGDMDCDGEVDFDDIDPFVLALGGEEGYLAAYPDCIWLNADTNGDGSVGFDDIDPFVALIGG